MNSQGLEWKRLFTEGAVILISILLAFSIDAWWDEQQESEDAMHQIDRVLTELETGEAILKGHIRDLQAASEASREFLSGMGPDPVELAGDELGLLFGRTFGVSTLSIPRGASQNLLSSGRLTRGQWSSVRQGLAELLSNMQEEERDSQELRLSRMPMMTRALVLIPGLNTITPNPVMEGYERSKFPFDSKALLSDMEFEGHLATHAIRLELNLRDHKVLLEDYKALIENISAARAAGN